MSKVFIIGGPGNISRGTIDYLSERNYSVAIFSRNTEGKKKKYPGIRFYEGDRSDKSSLERAFNDFGAELVIDTICFNPSEAVELYNIIKGKIRQLLFISTVDTYGYPLSRLPFREQDQFRPALGSYAQNKRTIELFYLDKYQKEGFPITIGRPSLSIGPGFCPMMFFDWGFKAVPRMKANMPILIPGDGNGLMHVGWGHDVGRMAGRIIGDMKAVGKEYTLSHENCITRDDYISLFTDYLCVAPERVYIPQEYIESFEGVDKIGKIYHLYRVNMAFSLDNFKRDFPDYVWLPLEKGVKEFIEVNYKKGSFPDPNEEIIDDKIIIEWKKRLAGW
jgi:nucleoside-diphosphate-sugar epimerase